MIEVKDKRIFNVDGAIRGMRNPLNSWDGSDSFHEPETNAFIIGEKDLRLAQKLILSGTDHSKFMRQIFVSMEINAPLFWWKEADTYKVATVANSTSTMHTLATTPITKECFSFDDELEEIGADNMIDELIDNLEYLRKCYLKTQTKIYWRALVQMLPEAWNQLRTWTANYQTLRNIYFARKNHKLNEWKDFCQEIEHLPYAKELICLEK